MNEPPTLGWLLAEWQDWGEKETLRAKPTVPRWKGEGDRNVARLKQDAWAVAARSIRPATAKTYAVGMRSWIRFTVELTKADKRMRAPMPANLQEMQDWITSIGNAGTAKTYLMGLKKAHELPGYEINTSSPMLIATVKGLEAAAPPMGRELVSRIEQPGRRHFCRATIGRHQRCSGANMAGPIASGDPNHCRATDWGTRSERTAHRGNLRCPHCGTHRDQLWGRHSVDLQICKPKVHANCAKDEPKRLEETEPGQPLVRTKIAGKQTGQCRICVGAANAAEK
ncbi:hypothetical protein FOZ63_029758 [Perkinsus olseni]|uniref:Uncharacterized protein n=2 Tax=Perkinsus olseni TaxID=32597 RepID=A0A7J6S8F6_PEROL|nr:hypothetical protein FOZ63_029758 [Perkinsus olseni]